jgi:hypothetical protein
VRTRLVAQSETLFDNRGLGLEFVVDGAGVVTHFLDKHVSGRLQVRASEVGIGPRSTDWTVSDALKASSRTSERRKILASSLTAAAPGGTRPRWTVRTWRTRRRKSAPCVWVDR